MSLWGDLMGWPVIQRRSGRKRGEDGEVREITADVTAADGREALRLPAGVGGSQGFSAGGSSTGPRSSSMTSTISLPGHGSVASGPNSSHASGACGLDVEFLEHLDREREQAHNRLRRRLVNAKCPPSSTRSWNLVSTWTVTEG